MNWLGTLCAVPLPSAGWRLCAAAASRRDLFTASARLPWWFFSPFFFNECEPKVMTSFSEIEFMGLINRRVCVIYIHTLDFSKVLGLGACMFCSVAMPGEAGPPWYISRGVGKEPESSCMEWCNPELQSWVLCLPQQWRQSPCSSLQPCWCFFVAVGRSGIGACVDLSRDEVHR